MIAVNIQINVRDMAALHENGQADCRNQQGLLEGIFNHWSQYESHYQWAGIKYEFFKEISYDAVKDEHEYLEHVIGQAVYANGSKQDDNGTQNAEGHHSEE